MRRWKRGLAVLLTAVMLAGTLPAPVWALEPEPQAMPDTQTESLDSESSGSALDEDLGADEASSMDAELPELSEIGVWIGGDYIAAIPVEDEPGENEPGMDEEISPQSLLPLKEKTLYLDLRSKGFLWDELKNVTLSYVLSEPPAGSAPAANAQVMWSKADGYNSFHDSFAIAAPDTRIDLTPESQDAYYVSLHLIVGTADQLNSANERYLVNVYLPQVSDLLTFSARGEDGQPVELYNGSKYYSEYRGGCYQIPVKPVDWEKTNGTFYLGMKLSSEGSEAQNKPTLTVYPGRYATMEEITAANIQPLEMSLDANGALTAGGHLADYSYQRDEGKIPAFTAVLERSGQVSAVLPFGVQIYSGEISFSIQRISTAASGSDVSDTHTSSHINGGWTYTIKLKPNHAANGQYYVAFSVHDPSKGNLYNNGKDRIQAAYEGNYAGIQPDVTDIKDVLFPEYSGGYGPKDFSRGVTFTVIDTDNEVHHITVKTQESQKGEELPPAPTPLSADTYFRMERADGYSAYVMPYDADSYYYNGYQTVLLLNESNGSAAPVEEQSIKPVFFKGTKVSMFAGWNKTSGDEQISGTTAVPFLSGEVIPYSAAAENNTHLKNYYVTFLTQQSGPRLFVNAANDEGRFDKEENIPVREVLLTEEYNYHHDIFLANIGDAPLEEVTVTLDEDAEQMLQLDEYWSIGATKTLAAFTTAIGKDADGHIHVDKLNNVAKIRLMPVMETGADGAQTMKAGVISGKLTITAKDQTPVVIKLTGTVGTPKITTETIRDGVKYVPYNSVIQTNNMYESNTMKFSVVSGSLPRGIGLASNGKLYGVPLESGDFTFAVKAVCNGNEAMSDSKEFTMTIADNDDSIVWNSTDPGYTVIENVPFTVTEYRDYTFKSEGTYDYFYGFYLDGQPLTEGQDFVSAPGSTAITIRALTMERAGTGRHTLAAEFRTNRDDTNTVQRAAQNYTSQVSGTGGGNTGSGGSTSRPGGGGDSSGGNDSQPPVYAVQAGTDSQTTNGTVSVNPSSAAANTVVTVTVKPDPGYELDKLTVLDAKGNVLTLSQKGINVYTFRMPASKVTVQAAFVEKAPTGTPFDDVRVQDWYCGAVRFVYENGLMVGTSASSFSPFMDTSRGMIVTILHKMAGNPAAEDSYFSDVPLNQYYAEAAAWSAEQGIVTGYGDGKFGSNDPLTREQLVVILNQYARWKGADTSAQGNLSRFHDLDMLNENARPAMAWASGVGLISGKGDGILDPTGTATRAEMAALLQKLDLLLNHS